MEDLKKNFEEEIAESLEQLEEVVNTFIYPEMELESDPNLSDSFMRFVNGLGVMLSNGIKPEIRDSDIPFLVAVLIELKKIESVKGRVMN